MINFQYSRASDVADAVHQVAAEPSAKFIAGGTNLIDLMKEDVERPSRLIDIWRLPLGAIEETPGGGLRIGALVPNSDLAYQSLIVERYPLLASAILAAASRQLRNMASTGGNLLQQAITRSPDGPATRTLASSAANLAPRTCPTDGSQCRIRSRRGSRACG